MSALTLVKNQADLAEQINLEHDAAHRDIASGVAHAIRAGELLKKAKAEVGHGTWLDWISTNCSFSARTATGYMRLANLDRANQQRVADFSLRQALNQIADKTPRTPNTDTQTRMTEDHNHAGVEDHHHHGDAGHDDAGSPDRGDADAGHGDGGVHVDHVAVMPIADIKIVSGPAPEEYQVQILVGLLDTWDAATPETRKKFLTTAHVHDEIMAIVTGRRAA